MEDTLELMVCDFVKQFFPCTVENIDYFWLMKISQNFWRKNKFSSVLKLKNLNWVVTESSTTVLSFKPQSSKVLGDAALF